MTRADEPEGEHREAPEGRKHRGKVRGRWSPSQWPKRRKIAVALFSAVLLIVVLGGTAYLYSAKPEYSLGILTDEPGMSYQGPDTVRSGFEVSMYRWMADYTDPEFDFTELERTIDNRDEALRKQGSSPKADAVIASYTMTDYRRTQVRFAGPYFLTRQGVMVKADGPLRNIGRAEDLADKTACAQKGSTSAEQLRRLSNGRVTVNERISLRECITDLYADRVDAVSTDLILLKGYANWAETPNLLAPDSTAFGTLDAYGIGLPLNASDHTCDQWTERIRRFITSGQWVQSYVENFHEQPAPDSMPSPDAITACTDPMPPAP